MVGIERKGEILLRTLKKGGVRRGGRLGIDKRGKVKNETEGRGSESFTRGEKPSLQSCPISLNFANHKLQDNILLTYVRVTNR